MKEHVSIVTPLHNCAEFVGETIESVIRQSAQDWEMIIVDDASTDSSAEIAGAYVARDRRIRLLRLTANAGPAVARNLAIEAASGRYIAFLDSDDSWHPMKLEKQIGFMKEHGHAITYTHFHRITESGAHLDTATPPDALSYTDLLKSNQIGCLTAVYDAGALGKVFMPQIRKRQDYGLWLRILRQVRLAYCLREPLATYRVRRSSLSSNKIALLADNWHLFRNIEGMSLARSSYYLGWNVVRSVFS